MISIRAQSSCNTESLLSKSWSKQKDNAYNAQSNPEGIVSLGIAENKVIYDMIQEKISSCNLSMLDESLTHYCTMSGTKDFRSNLCNFFTHFMKPNTSIEPENVHVVSGCGVAIETLGNICCDEGEGFLTPAPYFKSFKTYLGQRFSSIIYPVPLSKRNSFKLEVSQLQNAFNEAKSKGIIIKGLLLSNPINPLGICYTNFELESYLEFCLQNDIHLICDEIYMLSVYDENEKFTNILSVRNVEKYLHIIHVVWGFSKDFGLSGFRCGVILSFNKQVQKALASYSYFTTVSTATQYILSTIASDLEWIESFLLTNRKRLIKCRNAVVSLLKKGNISFILPTCGLFLVLDVSKIFHIKNKREEMEIFERFMQHGVYMVPGSTFEFAEPGWFRIVISNDKDQLLTGVQRIVDAVNSNKDRRCYN